MKFNSFESLHILITEPIRFNHKVRFNRWMRNAVILTSLNKNFNHHKL